MTHDLFLVGLCARYFQETRQPNKTTDAAYNECFTAPYCRICGMAIKNVHNTALYCLPKFLCWVDEGAEKYSSTNCWTLWEYANMYLKEMT